MIVGAMRKPKADPRPPYRPHGTPAAIRRHERLGESVTACEPCRLERNRLARAYYQQRKRKP